ncbi:MAG: AMP-binding protein, partial [Bdellovibrionota bacterium]
NFRLPASDLEWMAEDSGARALLADERYLRMMPEAASRLQKARLPVISLQGACEGVPSLSQAKEKPSSEQQRPHSVDLSETIYVLYTSGTTARPKGVEETHKGYAITASAPQLMPPEKVRFLNPLPLYHLAGLASLSNGMARGGLQILLDKFSPQAFLETLSRHKANMTFFVPTMMCDLLESGLLEKADVSTLRIFVYGAAPTPVPVLLGLIERLPKTMFLQVYSQTEGTSRVTMLGPEDHVLSKEPALREKQIRRLSSIGKVMPGVEASVRDAEGREVPPGGIGELWYQTPGKMKGYLNREGDTKKTVQDGWIISGDMVRMDEDGYVYIVGRSKDFLIRGGENIAPREIEEALESHPAVAEAAVVGKPDPRWGEVPVAFVRCPGEVPKEEELIAHCRARLAGFKVPEKVWIRQELPRNSLGKILKRELAEEAKKL